MNIHVNINQSDSANGGSWTGNSLFSGANQQNKIQQKNNDIINRSQQQTQRLTSEIMRNAVKQDAVFTDRTAKYTAHMTDNKRALDEANASAHEDLNRKAELKEQYNISDEDAALLDKYDKAKRTVTDQAEQQHLPTDENTINQMAQSLLSEDELARIQELGQQAGVSDYMSAITPLNANIEQLQSQMKDNIKNIRKDMYLISNIKLEHLKVDIMGTANREIDDVKTSAGKSLAFELLSEAKENWDDRMDEITEKQEERAEEKEEQDKLKKDSANDAETSASEETKDSDVQLAKQTENADKVMSDIENAVDEINKKLKQLDELLGGSVVDEYV